MRWASVVVRCVAFVALRKANDREGAGARITLHVEAPYLQNRPAKSTRNPVRNPVRRRVEFVASKSVQVLYLWNTNSTSTSILMGEGFYKGFHEYGDLGTAREVRPS